MKTKLVRIDLTNLPQPTAGNPVPLESLIHSQSLQQQQAGLSLKSTFVFGTDLILVLQG
jgi:hypothetical protein